MEGGRGQWLPVGSGHEWRSCSFASELGERIDIHVVISTRSWVDPSKKGIVVRQLKLLFLACLGLVYPNLRDPVLRLQLGKGLGHNTYGEPAWPNDLLYMFPICILAIVFLGFGQAVGMPIEVGEPADPFATPLEILPEWFLLPAFEILRAVPNKLLGIGAMIAIPVGLATVPILEAANPFANPIRRPVGTWLFIAGLVVSLALGYLSALPL